MKEISTTKFTKEYIGGKKVSEPMVLTYYGEPICYLYPSDHKVVTKIEKREDGRIERKSVYEAKPEKLDVDQGTTHTGQCAVCGEFGPLRYGFIVGEDQGLKARWMCQKCYEKGGNKPENFKNLKL